MNEWNIQSRSRVCQSCARPFADQESYHTLLFDEKREFVRLDVCANCWETQYSQGAKDRKGFVSHWLGVYEAPPAAPPEPIQKETAETLLRKLAALNQPQYTAAAYILSAMLERKRLLKVKETYQRDGQRWFIYEHTQSGDTFTILDPCLQLTQLEQVQREVFHLLEHGLPSAPTAENTSPSPGHSAEQASGPAASVPDSPTPSTMKAAPASPAPPSP
ncbi:MAG: hypothetical protein N3J91_15790 [Verrucomicrobiae bacterium]|nr:hypothetical protein [Verrucomicrobiae bacterium]